jgi:hypothetical protein
MYQLSSVFSPLSQNGNFRNSNDIAGSNLNLTIPRNSGSTGLSQISCLNTTGNSGRDIAMSDSHVNQNHIFNSHDLANQTSVVKPTKSSEYKNWSDVVRGKKINSLFLNLQVLPDEINNYILAFLSIKEFICLRILNKEFNQYVLVSLPEKLLRDDIIIDSKFANVYPQYILSKNSLTIKNLKKKIDVISIDERNFNTQYLFLMNLKSERKIKEKQPRESNYRHVKNNNQLKKCLESNTYLWCSRVNENLIRMNLDLVKNKSDWFNICSFSKLSDEFIFEFMHLLPFIPLFKHQILSTQVINRFKIYNLIKTKEKWDLIWEFQKVPEDFIRKNINNANWDLIWHHQFLTYDFVVEHLDMFKHLIRNLANEPYYLKYTGENCNFTINDFYKLFDLSKTI